MRELGKP